MALTTAQIQNAYVAFFNRPADVAGLNYWSSYAGSAADLLDTFAQSAEYQDLYANLNNTQLVNAVYKNLFNHAPDVAGLNYWVAQLDSGALSIGNVAYAINKGAQGSDAAIITNKVAAAEAFTDALDTTEEIVGYASVSATGIADVRSWLNTVTSDAASVTAATGAAMDTLIADVVSGAATNPGQTFTLTTSVDNVAGTAGNDTIHGISNTNTSLTSVYPETFGGLDAVDGGAGNDTLVITNPDGTMTLDTSVSVKNVENLSLTSAQNDVTADVQAWAGLTNVTVDNRGTGAELFLDTKSNVTTVSVKGSDNDADNVITDHGSAATTADVLASVTLDAVDTDNSDWTIINSDALTSLTVKNNTGDVQVVAAAGERTLNITMDKQGADGGGVEDATATTVNITASGTKSAGVWLDTDAAKTINFAGDKSISIALGDLGGNANVVTAINSTNSAGVTITTALGNTTAFTGGDGKDTITISNANTKATAMGAGDDKVNVTGTTLGTNGTIDGGDGVDTIAFSAADAAALSALTPATTYEARISNFEKVGLGQVAAFANNTVNLANLDDISYVVSAGTAAGTGAAEVATVTFSALKSGQTVTVGGQTYTAASSMTADAVASAFSTNLNVAGYTDAYASGNTVTFTATTVGDKTNLTGSVGQPAAPAAPSTSVTTQGVTGVTGVAEVFTVTFTGFATGADTIAFNGTTITLTDGDNANLIANAVAAGTYNNWTAVSNGNGSVTFTNKATVAVTPDVATTDFVVANAGAVGQPTVSAVVTNTQGVTAVTAATEVTTMTFSALRDGQSAQVAGRIVTANGADLTATQVADAFENGVNAGNAVVSGTLTGYTVTNVTNGNATVELTAAAAGDLTDLVGTASLATAAAAPALSIVDGNTTAGGGNLTLTNMANAGTLELTGDNNGSTTVTMKDATGTADSLNLKLNGAANLAAGVVNVAGVETIAIVATDSSADDVTVTNPTAVSTLALNAAAATTITLSGNHGVDFTGSTVTKVTSLDASGVVANVNTTGLTAAQIVAANGTAGAVTFTTAVTDKDVTIKTGNGDDVIVATSVGTAAGVTAGATITTGAGADYVVGGADNDIIDTGSENDWVDSTTGADSITLGAGNDTYWLSVNTDSVLAKYDTITDFSANTYGHGTNGAANAAGANQVDATKVTGDVIDLRGVIGAVAGIEVLVVTNAADAQTFIQNTADAAAGNTGIALDSTSNLLYIDLDSNGSIDSVIKLTGVTTITTAAFEI